MKSQFGVTKRICLCGAVCITLTFCCVKDLHAQRTRSLADTLLRLVKAEGGGGIGCRSGLIYINNTPSFPGPLFFIEMSLAGIFVDAEVTYFRNNNKLYYFTPGEEVLHSILYKYTVASLSLSLGYTIKCFAINRSVYSIAAAFSVSSYTIGDINRKKVAADLPTNNFVQFIKLNDVSQYELQGRLTRYLWIGNREFRLALVSSYPFVKKRMTDYFAILNEGYYYGKIIKAAQLELFIPLKPALRYNPLKMSRL
jgi:hypothetical protein